MLKATSPISGPKPNSAGLTKNLFLATEPKGPSVYFPKFTITFLLPSSHQKKNQAAFRIPSNINKFDLYQYLTRIYGLNVLKITTYNFLAKYSKEHGVDTRTRAWKKAIVDLDHEFKYPRLDTPSDPRQQDSSEEKKNKKLTAKKPSLADESIEHKNSHLSTASSSARVLTAKSHPFRPSFRLRRKRGRRVMAAKNQETGVRKIPRKRSKNKYRPRITKPKPPSTVIAESRIKRNSMKKKPGKDRRMMPRIIVDSIRQVPKEFLK